MDIKTPLSICLLSARTTNSPVTPSSRRHLNHRLINILQNAVWAANANTVKLANNVNNVLFSCYFSHVIFNLLFALKKTVYIWSKICLRWHILTARSPFRNTSLSLRGFFWSVYLQYIWPLESKTKPAALSGCTYTWQCFNATSSILTGSQWRR